jgi:O-antigen biosynthesis protein
MLSINITIHNKGYLIEEVLHRIVKYTTGTYEIVFVLDGCTDDSFEKVSKFIVSHRHIKTKILTAPNVFETKANNIAAKASSGEYIIIVQDDVLINEQGWNDRLLKPFKAFQDVFAVTGNTAHNWTFNEYSQDIGDPQYKSHRWCDILNHIDHANIHSINRDTFAVRDCINRAPFAVNASDLKKMGYFDEAYSPQDMDDHDLCYRVKNKFGKVVGCYWIDWESKPEYGGTRNESGLPKTWLLEAHHKNSRLFYERHRTNILTRTIEDRILK